MPVPPLPLPINLGLQGELKFEHNFTLVGSLQIRDRLVVADNAQQYVGKAMHGTSHISDYYNHDGAKVVFTNIPGKT